MWTGSSPSAITPPATGSASWAFPRTRCTWSRWASTWRDTMRRSARRTGPFGLATWRGWRRRRGSTCWRRATCACAARPISRARCWRRPGISPRSIAPIFGAEFHYRGELERAHKIEYLSSLDLLSVPSTYDEPKGIFLLEAMASGVPVVQPRRGSFPEMLAKTGGGVLVEPDDPASLADAIYRLWKTPEERAELGQRGAQGVRQHGSVSQMAERALEAYRKMVAAVAHA